MPRVMVFMLVLVLALLGAASATTNTTSVNATSTSTSTSTTTTSTTTSTTTTTTTTIAMCDALPAPTNGTVNLETGCNGGINGTTCEIVCDTGFLLPNGNAQVLAVCRPDDGWIASTTLTCEPVDCGALPLKSKMSLAAPCDSGYEDTCTITCADGHSVSGIPNATCTADASWTAFGECVDTDGCIGSACAAGSVCRDLPADEHVGTSSLPYACDCRGGYSGTPGPDGSGCVRRGITTLSAKGMVVQLRAADEVEVMLDGEQPPQRFALRREVGDVLSGLEQPGGAVFSLEAALDDLIDTAIADNTASLTLQTTREAAFVTARQDTLAALSELSTASASDALASADDATTNADANAAEQVRHTALSATLLSLENYHGSNDGKHSDLSEHVAGPLTTALADLIAKSKQQEAAVEAELEAARTAALSALSSERAAQDSERNRHDTAAGASMSQVDCENVPGTIWSNNKCDVNVKTAGFAANKKAPQTGRTGYQVVHNWNTNGSPLFMSSFRENSGSFQPDVSGVYACFANIQIRDGSGPYFRVIIARNEDLDLHAGSQAIRGDISVYETLSVSTIVPLSRSSSVGVYVYSSSDPSFTIGVESSFSCALLSTNEDSMEGFHADKSGDQDVGKDRTLISNWRDSGDAQLFSATPHFDLRSGIYTAPSNGLYMVQVNARLDGANTQDWVRVAASIDGAITDGMLELVDYDSSDNYHSFTGSAVYLLRRGQTVSVMTEANTDTFFRLQSESGFAVMRLSDAIRRPSCTADKWGSQAAPAGPDRPVGSWAARSNIARFVHCSDDLNEGTGVYTVPLSGVYHVAANLRLKSQSQAGACVSWVRTFFQVNGQTSFEQGLSTLDQENACAGSTQSLSSVLYFNKGDTIRPMVRSQRDIVIETHSMISFTLLTTDKPAEYVAWARSRGATGDSLAVDPYLNQYLFNYASNGG